MFDNRTMIDLFGSYEDENGILYHGFYRYELQEIKDEIISVRDMFTVNELSSVVKYLLYQTFSDSANIQNRTCVRLAKSAKIDNK